MPHEQVTTCCSFWRIFFLWKITVYIFYHSGQRRWGPQAATVVDKTLQNCTAPLLTSVESKHQDSAMQLLLVSIQLICHLNYSCEHLSCFLVLFHAYYNICCCVDDVIDCVMSESIRLKWASFYLTCSQTWFLTIEQFGWTPFGWTPFGWTPFGWTPCPQAIVLICFTKA
jgi:hypothetical protein